MGVVVVVLVIIFAFKMRAPGSLQTGEPAENEMTALEPSEDVGPGSINASSPAAPISYQNALLKYKDARLQLDTTCQGSPDRMTFKNGTNIMIDNRSPNTRTVKVGSTFTIKPWGFKIVNLSSATLPATWYVDCDQSQNVSTILIQK